MTSAKLHRAVIETALPAEGVQEVSNNKTRHQNVDRAARAQEEEDQAKVKRDHHHLEVDPSRHQHVRLAKPLPPGDEDEDAPTPKVDRGAIPRVHPSRGP